ncbi:hypothetical protein DICVIV_05106 [Dictyocaulus viviparus]|uniref:MAM domain-containing protein n=1 Tax=Dictyocaulus viviparus TaxID=29172 RepID=A0A0D8Y2I6_DICVI|nr:hypothetical protein DICVIV_05106 [Dictyocaulus viviparus]
MNSGGSFAYAVGPGISSLTLGPFELPRNFYVEFCFYISSYQSRLVIHVMKANKEERMRYYVTNNITGNAHHWICDKIFVPNGTYDAIEFSAEDMRNEYSYVGLDQIDIYDPILRRSECD